MAEMILGMRLSKGLIVEGTLHMASEWFSVEAMARRYYIYKYV